MTSESRRNRTPADPSTAFVDTFRTSFAQGYTNEKIMCPKKALSSKSVTKKPTVAASRRKTATTASSPAEPKSSVTLHILGGASYQIMPDEDFQRTAMYWEYVLRNRIRWAHDPNPAQAVTTRVLE